MKWKKGTEMLGFTNIETIDNDEGIIAIIGEGKTKLPNERNITDPQYLYDIDLLIKLLKRLRKQRNVQYMSLYTASHTDDAAIPFLIFREGFTIGVIAPRYPIDEAP